jgi:outer membrane lipoprotein-sorting protein
VFFTNREMINFSTMLLKPQRKHIQVFNLVFIIMFFLFIASCSTYRKTIKEPMKAHGTEYLLEQMKAKEISAGYFTARFSAELTKNKEKISFNGQIRIKKDSIIWLTLSPALGIEMGRLLITNDSIKWMNRLETNFLLATTEHLAGMVHPLLEFDLLQALIFGNDLTLYDNTQFKSNIDNREYKLSVSHRRRLKRQLKEDTVPDVIPMQSIWLDPETFRITKVSIRDLQDRDAKIDVSYQRFVVMGSTSFASRQQYDIQGGGNKLSLDISFSRTDTPETSSFPFTIPEKYVSIK